MKLRRTLAVTAAAITALALAACSGGSSAPGGSGGGTDGGTLTIGHIFEVPSYDPATAQEGTQMAYWQAVYDTLLFRAPSGEIEPMLATEWEYNDDNTALTLKLRDDVTFTDGAKFDAEAVKANIEHFQTAGGSQSATMIAVESVDVVDDTTVTLNLNAPEPALLIYLTNAGGMMGSPAALGTDDIKTKPVGSGPYTLDNAATVIGTEYTYVKKDDYWNPDLQHYDKIIFKVLPDATARYNALVSGQIDVAPLDAKTATSAEEKGMIGHNQQLDWRGLILFDRGGTIVPALGDVRVRQAINMAIDKEGILASIEQGRGSITSQVFAESSTAYIKDLKDPYPFDPEKAKQLLVDAGYADGFAMEMPTAAAVSDPALNAVIADNLAAVGITVNWVDVPVTEFLQELMSGKYPATWMSLFRPSTWVTVQQTIAPPALWNASHYEDPKVDALIHDIQFATDAAEETAKAQELNQYVIDQAWFAPWYAPDWLLYANDKVAVELQAEQAMPSIYGYQPAK